MVLSFEDLFPAVLFKTKRWKSVFTVKWFWIKTYCMYDSDSKVSIIIIWKLIYLFLQPNVSVIEPEMDYLILGMDDKFVLYKNVVCP